VTQITSPRPRTAYYWHRSNAAAPPHCLLGPISSNGRQSRPCPHMGLAAILLPMQIIPRLEFFTGLVGNPGKTA